MGNDLTFYSGKRLSEKTFLELEELEKRVKNVILGEKITIQALEELLRVDVLPQEIIVSVRERIGYFSSRLSKFEKLFEALEEEVARR